MVSMLAGVLSAVAVQPVAAGQAQLSSEERREQAADAVARSAQFAGEAADETGDCGGLAYLLKALPGSDSLLGMTESYRGCESPVTVNLQYESDSRELAYTLGIFDAALADLPEGSEYWQAILDVNRESMQSLMHARLKLAGNEQGSSEKGALADGSEMVMFREGKDWVLVAVPGDRYALRIDLAGAGADDAQARALLLEAAAALDMSVLK